MNVNKVLSLLIIIMFVGCSGNNSYRWEIETLPEIDEIEIINISQAYFDNDIDNNALKAKFPAFFEAASDSLLNQRRADTIGRSLHNDVEQLYGNQQALADSLEQVFRRLKHFYPRFEVPHVYTFTGELSYQYPVAYFPESKDMVIGLDWFLGEENENYDRLAVLDYYRTQMNPSNFKPKVVESLARQMVPYDIRNRKFIERMIYEGKLLIIQDALLPEASDAAKIGFTPAEIAWANENAPEVYMYFTEEQLFFSDDKKLNERFLDPAPFSKFFSENDTESPGRIGAWMGWQICRAYLDKNREITLQQFLNKEDLLEIFKASGYKPTK